MADWSPIGSRLRTPITQPSSPVDQAVVIHPRLRRAFAFMSRSDSDDAAQVSLLDFSRPPLPRSNRSLIRRYGTEPLTRALAILQPHGLGAMYQQALFDPLQSGYSSDTLQRGLPPSLAEVSPNQLQQAMAHHVQGHKFEGASRMRLPDANPVTTTEFTYALEVLLHYGMLAQPPRDFDSICMICQAEGPSVEEPHAVRPGLILCVGCRNGCCTGCLDSLVNFSSTEDVPCPQCRSVNRHWFDL